MLLSQLAARVKNKQAGIAGGGPDVPVIISADKSVRYESVVRVMDTLQRAGVRRVGAVGETRFELNERRRPVGRHELTPQP